MPRPTRREGRSGIDQATLGPGTGAVGSAGEGFMLLPHEGLVAAKAPGTFGRAAGPVLGPYCYARCAACHAPGVGEAHEDAIMRRVERHWPVGREEDRESGGAVGIDRDGDRRLWPTW